MGEWRVTMNEVIEARGSDEALGKLAHGIVDGLVLHNTGFPSLDVRPVGTEPIRPRRFVLERREDETGLSGTGQVAWGVVFPDGTAATRWNAPIAQTCVWASLDDVLHVHGHQGRTDIVFLD